MQVLEGAVTGLTPKQPYVLVLSAKPDGTGLQVTHDFREGRIRSGHRTETAAHSGPLRFPAKSSQQRRFWSPDAKSVSAGNKRR
jgi:hypothetical protein